MPPQPIIGTATPKTAIKQAAGPVCLSSFISVSIPAIKRSIITPISAVFVRKSDSWSIPIPLGPKRMPAISAPTTCGR